MLLSRLWKYWGAARGKGGDPRFPEGGEDGVGTALARTQFTRRDDDLIGRRMNCNSVPVEERLCCGVTSGLVDLVFAVEIEGVAPVRRRHLQQDSGHIRGTPCVGQHQR